ncbi:DUF1553 domain-containing protein [Haloferula chungangensis]|uniref:DUF1553 domain-containing protein n=1 Tax=Haloferula chungangensis TaxID=1048331 RepID=A0ABW2L4W8_9BACT
MRFKTLLLPLILSLLLSHCRDSLPMQADPSAGTPDEVPAQASISIPDEVTFNEHIQPILSEYCYHCHGPDEKTRVPEDAPYRLDIAEEALAPRENGKPAIIAGDPDASLLVKLIRSKDADSIMPPPRSHKELKPEQIALLEKWVEQGAEYQDHWSLIPVERPEPPAVGETWASNPIDPFIFEKLEAHGLAPNPQGDPERFYRRLHLDLTGLPPTPEDIAAFSWETLDAEVDRLLATTSSAEHFARYWLDAARYADTHGIHIDNYRAIWPYRDWVINAFKANMPWDQFTIEQIAGDMLPDATLDQMVATGFNRCLPTTGEGGAIAEEYEAIYAQDRTDTTSAVWLGLTMGCAACHDHKFDPISQKDTYSFNAFFRNTPMTALDKNNADHPPNIFVPHMDDRTRWASLSHEINEVEKELEERRMAAHPDFKMWLASAKPEPTTDIDSTLSVHLPLNDSDTIIRGRIDGEAREWPSDLPRVAGPAGDAPLVSAHPLELGDLASFSRSDQVTYGGFIRIEGKPSGAVIARMNAEENFRGWDIYLEGGKITTHVIDSWNKSANKLVSPRPLKPATWHHVMFTFDGSGASHKASALFIDGVKVPAKLNPNTVGGNISTKVPLSLGSRHKQASKLHNGKVALQDFRFYRRLLGPAEIKALAERGQIQEILATSEEQRSRKQINTAFSYYISSIDSPSQTILARLNKLKAEQRQLSKRGSVSLIMKEKADSEPFAHILNRGIYSDLGEKVSPNTPSALPPMPEDAPRNRLGLARWLVSKDNPLTARVTMNRLWYQLFGNGIVETVGDFGIMGARPSHPQLLDWLAAEFMESGWDHRHMVKTIVTSAAYRQSETITAGKLEIDPGNRLVSRGPRYRLDAEQIRDLALAASGLLTDKFGGPPTKPYQPEGVWEAVAMPQSNTKNYQQDSGKNLYRRSIYTFWKRTAPHPAMEILNAPAREVTCVARERTNTPLQAFVTLNDPQFVEASRVLAEHAVHDSVDFGSRLDFIATRLIGRCLAKDESVIVRTTLEHALSSFKSNPDAARSLIATGATKPDASLDPVELAAWTLIASQLLNLDETLTK